MRGCPCCKLYKVNRVNKLSIPLKFYEETQSFKLFICDLGLLGALSDVPIKDVLIGSNIFCEYKGAFTEQYVLQQLLATDCKPYYDSNEKGTCELDFVIQRERIHPIEVKAEENLKSKSLRTIVNAQEGLTGWRFSMSNYREQDWLVNVPLYLVQAWIESQNADLKE